MNGGYRKEGRSHAVTVAIIIIALGGGGVSGLVWAAAKGAFGKLGDVTVGWLLEHSTNPKDLEFQRALALGREAEAQKQAEFERQEAREKSKHDRDMELRRQAARDRFPTVTFRREPIIIPRGACVLDGDNYRCNPDQNDYSQPIQGYDPSLREGQFFEDSK